MKFLPFSIWDIIGVDLKFQRVLFKLTKNVVWVYFDDPDGVFQRYVSQLWIFVLSSCGKM